jgi:hypothetical protein
LFKNNVRLAACPSSRLLSSGFGFVGRPENLNRFDDEDVSGGEENALRRTELPLVGDRGEAPRGGDEKLSGDGCGGLWKAHEEGDRAGIVAIVNISGVNAVDSQDY